MIIGYFYKMSSSALIFFFFFFFYFPKDQGAERELSTVTCISIMNLSIGQQEKNRKISLHLTLILSNVSLGIWL